MNSKCFSRVIYINVHSFRHVYAVLIQECVQRSETQASVLHRLNDYFNPIPAETGYVLPLQTL